MSARTARTLTIVAIVSAFCALALPAQRFSGNSASHYALTRALADGTAVIDPWADMTFDRLRVGGHYYANKAPGLALVTVPMYVVARALGVVGDDPDDDDLALWLMTVWGAVVPAMLLLALVQRTATRLAPGTGWPAALALGAGTMLLPMATLFYSHVLTSLLAFAAFAVAIAERRGARPRPLLLLAAGALAGAAVSVEYPTALAGAIVGVYAMWGRRPLVRAATYAGGVLVGVLPLLLYQWIVFGSLLQTGYTVTEGVDGGADHAGGKGFYGSFLPSIGALTRVLFSDRGLLTLTPVVATAGLGLVLLARRGARAEALVIGAVAAAYLLYVSTLTLSPGWVFGGGDRQSRFLVVMIPFLAPAIGIAFRHAFALVFPLLLVSIVFCVLITVGDLQIPRDGSFAWWKALTEDDDWTKHAIGLLGGPEGRLGTTLFVLLVAIAASCAFALSRPPAPDAHTIAVAAGAGLAWLTIFVEGPQLTEHLGRAPAVAILALFAAVSLAVGLQARERQR